MTPQELHPDLLASACGVKSGKWLWNYNTIRIVDNIRDAVTKVAGLTLSSPLTPTSPRRISCGWKSEPALAG